VFGNLIRKQLTDQVRRAVLIALARNKKADLTAPEIREDIADDVIMELGKLSEDMFQGAKAFFNEVNAVKRRPVKK
jgi:hypothetical protein